MLLFGSCSHRTLVTPGTALPDLIPIVDRERGYMHNAVNSVEAGRVLLRSRQVSFCILDVYDRFLAGRFIGVTGLAARIYTLEFYVDPADRVLESEQRHNAASVRVWLDPDRRTVQFLD